MVKKAFLLISLLFLATYTASAEKASKYTISIDGGSTTEYSYTDWPALMTQVKTYTGTAAARVTVTITGNDFDANDNMPTVQNVNTILCAGDNVAYTTFKFVDCTFQKGDQYDCISFGYATVKGVVLEFHGCTLEERLYGNEAGTAEGTHYNVDVKFYGCTFASASTGGRYFGDLLFDGCEFTNPVSWDNTEAIVNAQNATDGVFCRRQNSVGDESTFTLKNCTFAQSVTDATWFRFIYAPDFENYDIDLGQYFYPCLSDTYVIEDLAKYNADKLGTGKVKTLEIRNNDISSSKNVLLLIWPARVKYDANAPESATVSGETKDDNLYEPGQDFTVKTNGFSCAGYAFTGWNTLANPTELNPGTAYTGGQVAQIPFTIGYKLYAQWAEPAGTGPFLVVETATKYPTLQQAVDAAASGNTIKVLSGSEYDAATYSTDNPASYYREAWGGEVLIMGKSLTIIPENSANPTPLKDFVFTVYGASTLSDIKFEGLKLTGKSKFMVFPGFEGQGINSLSIKNCDIDVNGGLPSSNRPITGLLHLSGTSTIGFPNYTDGASIVFCGTPAGDISSFQVTGTTFKNRNANRYIAGRGRFRSVEISGNQFGAADCRFGGMFMVTEDGGYSSEAFTIKIHDNSFYCSKKPILLYFTTGGFNNTKDNQVFVYDNEINTTPAGRYTFTNNYDGIVEAIKLFDVTGGTTTVTTYGNTLNGYCYNYIYSEGANSHTVLNAQPGHTWDYGETGAHIKNVPSGSTKNPDIYYNNKAYKYNEATGEFIEHDLGDAQYCDRCDELHVIPGLTITANGLEEGQSAVFVVSRVSDVDTPLLQVMITGEAGGGGSRTVLGLETGNYKVTPASWSWTYDISPASKSITLDGTNQAEAEFTLTKKDSTLPENVEKVKVSNF